MMGAPCSSIYKYRYVIFFFSYALNCSAYRGHAYSSFMRVGTTRGRV